jgi:hypothetical protein
MTTHGFNSLDSLQAQGISASRSSGYSILVWPAVDSGHAPECKTHYTPPAWPKYQSIAMPSSTFNDGLAAHSRQNNRQAVPDSGPMEE